MKGTIETVKTNEVNTKKGKTTVYYLRIDGEDYSTFLVAAKDLTYGNTVEFEYDVNGKYKNIKSIKKIGQTKITDSPEKEDKPDSEYWSKRNLEIRGQALMKIAVQIVLKAHEKDQTLNYELLSKETGIVAIQLDDALCAYLRAKMPPEAMI